MATDYEEVLEAIEDADAALADALAARASAIKRAKRLRMEQPDEFFRQVRDEECIRKAVERVPGLPARGVEAVFREVLSVCHAIDRMEKVQYLGPTGSFAHVAAQRRFGSSVQLESATNVASALEGLSRGEVSHLILPLETSSDGAVTATLHGLAKSDAHICGEVEVNATYILWSATGNRADVEKIYGAPAAFAACENYLRREFPRATSIDVPNLSVATEMATSDHGAAVVGPSILGASGRLAVVQEGIEDEKDVSTRYAVVGSKLPSRTGHDRTIVAMAVNDAPGALYASLRPFADRDINLTRLESRPFRGSPWRYMFFLEMDGHVTDRPILTGLEELRSISPQVRILGSYPRPRES